MNLQEDIGGDDLVAFTAREEDENVDDEDLETLTGYAYLVRIDGPDAPEFRFRFEEERARLFKPARTFTVSMSAEQFADVMTSRVGGTVQMVVRVRKAPQV